MKRKLMMNDEFYKAEKQRMASSLEIFFEKLDEPTIQFLIISYSTQSWDWKTSDGCTGVSERYWPNQYFPPCVAHDYQCVLANRASTRKEADRVRKAGDKLFHKANKAYGLPWFSRTIRYWGVRRYWMFVGRWKIPKR